jgi:RimJ/RimL family protein N-acetyltransferase
MIIEQNSLFMLRSLNVDDAFSLAKYADNRDVWINLRDAFPSPYKLSDAEKFISMIKSNVPETVFAICHQNECIGAIGYKQGKDVERIGAEIGYWIGEPFWGKGIVTGVVKYMTGYIFSQHDVKRIFAVPFAWNKSSHRVLEKTGFELEGRMRCSVIKDGKITDQLLYAFIKS